MKFSTKDRYALLLMVELASATPGEYLPLKAVSDNQGISVKYLEQIVAPLSKAGLVESGRGSPGRLPPGPPGYRDHCGRDPACGGRRADGYPLPGIQRKCPHRAQCETLGFWEGLNQVINQYIDSATLEKLSSEYLSH